MHLFNSTINYKVSASTMKLKFDLKTLQHGHILKRFKILRYFASLIFFFKNIAKKCTFSDSFLLSFNGTLLAYASQAFDEKASWQLISNFSCLFGFKKLWNSQFFAQNLISHNILLFEEYVKQNESIRVKKLNFHLQYHVAEIS